MNRNYMLRRIFTLFAMVILFGGLFLTSGNRTAHAATSLSVYPTKGISSTGSFDLVANRSMVRGVTTVGQIAE